MNMFYRRTSGERKTLGWPVMLMAIAAGTLVVAWPMPGVIALRYALIGALFLVLVFDHHLREGFGRTFSSAKWELTFYCGFLIWALVVAIIVRGMPSAGLDSLRSQWLMPSLALGIGMGLGGVDISVTHRRWIWTAIITALFIQPFFHILFALWLASFGGGIPPEYAGLMDHRANITYVISIAAAFVLGDLVLRAVSLPPIFSSVVVSVLLLSALAASTLLADTRNGVLSLIVMLMLSGAMGLIGSRLSLRSKFLIALGLLVSVGLYGWLGVELDSRWARFTQTVPVALDIDGERAWVNTDNQPLPLAADGKPVEITAYERIAWARAGVRLVLEHPLGTGLGGDAFKLLVKQEFGEPRAAHSHDGYIDLALDVGLPGLALMTAFLGGLAWAGLKSTSGRGGSYGVVLALLVAGYAARAFLDSIFRVHIIEEFLFFVGYVMGLRSVELSDV